ncbi:DUF3040 domain-containing protein [Nocardioides marmoriginsengisoli]|uniref:DUF3040 domain-containing protein n=1 Tax=Nocardioides marmoriginsengisoli TaxID=661483 RepID=A0A3N0CNY5_9ACTN|nr:DUF3040 domain-containing protein [Nocardioides marmoriginsengisoli]RNL65011.1 DUF3040 domain-containing protein [Nocardioides marmoriginsengisoli]
MPLSEEELRLLEQMERALAAEDPKFVSALQGRTLRHVARMRTLIAGVVLLAGMALLIGAAMTGGAVGTALGVLAFLVMLAAAMVGLAAWRGHKVPEERPSPDALFDFDDHPHRFEVIDGGRASKPKRQRPQRAPRQRKQGTFMQRMEQRWQHRRDQGF